MIEAHIKEQLSRAYTRTLASYVGIVCEDRNQDYGIDGSFLDVDYIDGRYSENGFGIDFQLKSTVNFEVNNDGDIIYDLEVKNYKDLIRNVRKPRILILYILPKEKKEWLDVNTEGTIVKKCAWWCSLKGGPETNNKSTVRITIPKEQLLTPQAIENLMKKIKEGEEL